MAREKRIPVGAPDVEERKQRLPPIFDPREKGWFPKDPKKYRIWVNDTRGSVQSYLDSGFRFVEKKDLPEWGQKHKDVGSSMESRVSVPVGRAGTEENVTAFLMEMDMEDWLEIKAMSDEEKQRPIRDIRRQLDSMKANPDNFVGNYDIKTPYQY